MERFRRVPALGVLAERQMGGFLAISAVVGVAVGLGAAALVSLVDWSTDFLRSGGLDGHSPWLFLAVPSGFLVAWALARFVAPEVEGDGVPEAIGSLAVHGGRMRTRSIPLKILATTATLAPGGSAGREGPIAQVGAAIGSVIARRFHLGEDQIRSLVAAGAAAGIGASFNAPIAGMLFALEVILSSFATRHLSSIVVASVAAAVTTRTIVGEELAIRAGVYSLGEFSELLWYAGLAIVVAAVGLLFLKLLGSLESLRPRQGLGWMRPLIAGLAVAALVFIEPRLYGTGQEVTNGLILGERLSEITGTIAEYWWVLALVALGKAVATSLTISSGASGGAFMPSLFMGAAVGTGFARFVEQFTDFPIQPGAYAVVGMAAMFAVVGRAPLTAILIVFEVTGARDYRLILPLMLTATLATFLAERFSQYSVYTMALHRKGIRVRRGADVDLLETVDVATVMAKAPFVVSPQDRLVEVLERLNSTRSHGVPVVEAGRLVGILTISDITRAGETDSHATVGPRMTPRPATVVPSTPVSRALERMAALGVGRLPVVDESDPTLLVGMFRREDAVRAYHEALTANTDAELHRKRLAQRTHPTAGYFDFRIPPGSLADGRAVRDVTWPEGSTLVSVRRMRTVVVPTGDTVLAAGDVVTAFGTPASKERVIERLNSSSEEPTAEIELEKISIEREDGNPDDNE